MKKKSCIIISICLVLCMIIGGIIYDYIPKKYDIYINGEIVNHIYAYRYNGYMYLPVLGIMEAYGYKVNRIDGNNPEFFIDGVKYQLNIEGNDIYEGENRYLGVCSGQCFLNISDDDVYALILEIDIFFTSIGKEPTVVTTTDTWERCIYLEIDMDISS